MLDNVLVPPPPRSFKPGRRRLSASCKEPTRRASWLVSPSTRWPLPTAATGCSTPGQHGAHQQDGGAALGQLALLDGRQGPGGVQDVQRALKPSRRPLSASRPSTRAWSPACFDLLQDLGPAAVTMRSAASSTLATSPSGMSGSSSTAGPHERADHEGAVDDVLFVARAICRAAPWRFGREVEHAKACHLARRVGPALKVPAVFPHGH